MVLWSRGGAHLTKPGWSKPHTHSNPTNLALFRHKITLYRFNQGGSYYYRGLKWEQGGWAPEPPHFNHWVESQLENEFTNIGLPPTAVCRIRSHAVTSAKIMFLPLSVCLSEDNSKTCRRILMKFFGGMERMTNNSWSDFGDDSDHEACTGIFKRNFYHCGITANVRMLCPTPEIMTTISCLGSSSAYIYIVLVLYILESAFFWQSFQSFIHIRSDFLQCLP